MALNLGKMVGPLPLGVWVVAVGGALGLSQLAKFRQKDETVYDPGGIPFPTGMPLQEPPFSGATVGLPSTANPYPGPPVYATNTEWRRAAGLELKARNYDPYTVDQTLGKYLQGLDPLTDAEQGIVNAALRFTGFPPQPPSVAPPQPPPANPAPPANRHDVLQEGEFSGVGFYNAGTITTRTGTYAYIRDQRTAAAIVAAGGKLFFQPTPGVFMEVDPAQSLDPGTYGTPLYQRIV